MAYDTQQIKIDKSRERVDRYVYKALECSTWNSLLESLIVPPNTRVLQNNHRSRSSWILNRIPVLKSERKDPKQNIFSTRSRLKVAESLSSSIRPGRWAHFRSHRRTILDSFAECRRPSLWSLLWSLIVERFLPSTGLILLVTDDICQSARLGLDAL